MKGVVSMKDLKVLPIIGGTIVLLGVAWKYGQVMKLEGAKEVAKEFAIQLLDFKMILENDLQKRERA